MRVLVTGASGLLGRGVAMALAARGDDVTVLQRRPAGLGLREVLADLGSPADAARVPAAFNGQDAVVHLAAKVNVTGPWRDYRRANIDGTVAVVDGCRSAGVGRLVHVSSPSVAHVGPSIVGAGAAPADPRRARGHYARSKAVAERIALAADRSDLAVLAVRPHLVWGPGDTQLVERIVQRARNGRLGLIGTGAALVDSTYVSNAVDALVAAVDRCQDARGQALVVSNGEPRPVAELVAGICAAAGVPAPRRHVPRGVAWTAGAAVEALWSLRSVGSLRPAHVPWRSAPWTPARVGGPPMTRFLAEQLSTAHWFDQRHTRSVLRWSPSVSIDQGMELLARSYRGYQPAVPGPPLNGPTTRAVTQPP